MLNIENAATDELAHRLSEVTGRSVINAVIYALREQLRREEGNFTRSPLSDDLMEIGKRCAALPVIDERSLDEILGYDESGTWS
jgi:antitoxin VapB